MRASRALIHLGNFRGNFHAIRDRIGPERRICVPVKADAYGHGALPIARAALEEGAFCLALATVEEGAQLRAGGIAAPILLLSQPFFEEIPGILENGLAPLVSDIDFAEALNRKATAAGRKIPVHLKIDTGMGRMGCTPEEAPGLAKFIAGCAALEYAGTATHLAVADSVDSGDIAYTQAQLALFREALGNIRAAGLDPGIVHAANSGAVLLHPDSWFDMVRPGILLYGYQTVETDFKIDIRPLMELRTNIVFIKKIKQGESLSYGRTWAAPRNTTVGVLPVGYADGLPRLASNRWQVSIRGRAYPLVGRICMDQCLVDLGPDAQVCRWDEASVFGGPAPDAAALASLIDTIPYEITCNINKRVPRVYC
jgi:alanine racemase